MGVIATGVAYNYLKENISSSENSCPILKISAYPFPKAVYKTAVTTVNSRTREYIASLMQILIQNLFSAYYQPNF